jgi:hypothetical protein
MSLAVCAACWLIVSGWMQPRPSVVRAVERLHRGPAPTAVDAVPVPARLGRIVRRSVGGERLERWRQPLRLIGRPLDVHVGMLVLAAGAGAVVPSLLLGLLQAAGLVSLSVWVPAALSIAAAIVAPLLVHSDAMSRSADVAVDLRHQLGAYLDVVTMLLAGNTGHEGALGQAARAGDGLLFSELRRRMRDVSTTGRSLVVALDLVAADFGIVELEQVAATVTLSAAEGAPVARSLAAKCATLRSTLAADEEAAARIRIDKVTPPLVGMALLFMALIIYPALDLG